MKTESKKKLDIRYSSGRLYFSKTFERRVLFFMTLGMLGAGIFVRLI